jgi:hypothetical protein
MVLLPVSVAHNHDYLGWEENHCIAHLHAVVDLPPAADFCIPENLFRVPPHSSGTHPTK